MYQGVTYSLLSLSAIGVMSAVVGLVSISPLALLSSFVVVLLISVLVNAALSYIFGKPQRHESAIITGLILFFLLPPTVELQGLVGIGIVAAIAQISKYMLAYRGRHIFNPAAIAVVISAAAGLTPAIWWIATPMLTLPVLAFGTFTLYRTNRLAMGYVFVGVSILVLSIGALLRGSFDMAQLISFVTSYPILFLGFYMLTEPLTQAPRHKQRLFIAVAVATIASLQVSLGSIFITPEIALVAGNLVAFLLGQRGAVRLRFDGRRQLNGNQIVYTFTSLRKLKFEAGQYLELTVPHAHPDSRGQRRMFTIASSPNDNQVRLIIRNTQPTSSLKSAMASLQKGSVISATGIYGDFVLPKNKSEKLLFVAGGIGITPFLSHLQTLRTNGESRDIMLLYFVNTKHDAVMMNELEKSTKHGLKFVIIDKRVSIDAIEKNVKDISKRTAYVSGPPSMVDATNVVLKRLKVHRIITDQFDGY